MPLLGLPGISELLLIFGALLLLFGGKKLPELGGAIGESIKNFKKGIKGEEEQKSLQAKSDKDKDKDQDKSPTV
jgi:sec-independent protein translocase protein TatA